MATDLTPTEYIDSPVKLGAANYGTNTGAFDDPPSNVKDIIRFIKPNNQIFYLTPPPLLGFSTSEQFQGATLLGTNYDITLRGTFVPEINRVYTDLQRTEYNITGIQAISDLIRTASYIEIRNNVNSTYPYLSLPVLNARIDFAESTCANYIEYTASINSFLPSSGGSTSGYASNAKVTNIPVNVNIESFSDNVSIEPDSSFGYAYTNPSVQIYRYNRSLTAKARPSTNFDIVRHEQFSADLVSGAVAFVKARLAISETGTKIYENKDTKIILHAPYSNLLNTSVSESFDLAELSYTVNINGLLASGEYLLPFSGGLETSTSTINRGVDSPFTTVTIDGTVLGYTRAYLNENHIANHASRVQGAYATFNSMSDNGKFQYDSLIFKRAQTSCRSPLNVIPKSISVSDSALFDGQIKYSVTYDNRPYFYVSGVLSENINISDTYPTDVYASIPVIGRVSGPVLQFMNTSTNYERDVSIELILDRSDLGINNTPHELLRSKPSVNSAFRKRINELIRDFTPAGKGVGSVFLKNLQENFNMREGRYTLNIGWVYQA